MVINSRYTILLYIIIRKQLLSEIVRRHRVNLRLFRAYYVFDDLVKNGTGSVELWHSACKLASSVVKFVAGERTRVTCCLSS